MQHHSYPIAALPDAVQQAIWAAEAAVQSPIPLIAASALSTMATACQGLVDVAMPNGQIAPVSLFFITSAESGERKTATDKLLSKAILEAQARWAAEGDFARAAFAADLEIWQIEHGVLESNFKRALKKRLSCAELREELTRHAQQRPQPPAVPRLLYSDTTMEALLLSLHSGWPCGALTSSEGSSLLNGHAMRHLGVANELWDGSADIRVDRKTGPSFALKDARLSLSVMVQHGPIVEFVSRNRGEAGDIGFLARALIAEPQSTQGTRRVDGHPGALGEAALHRFHERVSQLLEKSRRAHSEGLPRKILTFSPEAASTFLHFASWVESQLGPQGNFSAIRGFASKLTNHMARLAAVIHYFGENAGPINIESTMAAIRLAEWYAGEQRRLLGADDPIAARQEYARLLYEWLVRDSQRRMTTDCRLNDLYNLGPNKLRRRAKLNIALDELQSQGRIQVYRGAKPAFVRLMPAIWNGSPGVFS